MSDAVAVLLPEAGLLAAAGTMLVEVLGRIRAEDREIEFPAMSDLPCAPGETSLWAAVERYAADEAGVPARLAGAAKIPSCPGLDIGDPQGVIAVFADRAVAAARTVSDGDAPVAAPWGTVPAREYLLRLAVTRSLLAHHVAAYLGSTACPLPEDLARQLFERTAPSAQVWRELGIFREPLPVPPLASWRDRFLLTAGHLPHPLGH